MQAKNILIAIVVIILVLGLGGGAIYITRMQPKMSPTEIVESPTPSSSDDAAIASSINSDTQQTAIEGVVMNTSSAGPEVGLLSNQASFNSTDETIYITVLLAPTVTADRVVLKITYALDSSELGPVNAVVKTQGTKKYATFQMGKPPTGWLKGSYLAVFALPTGESKEVVFTVN